MAAAASIDAVTGQTGGGVDHVGLLLDLALGGRLALVGAGEAGEVRSRLGQVLDVHLGLRVGVLDALLEARLELLDQRDVDTADEADVRRLVSWRRRDTGQVGALLLGEDQVGDVLGVDRGVVDDAEGGVRELRRGALDAAVA